MRSLPSDRDNLALQAERFARPSPASEIACTGYSRNRRLPFRVEPMYVDPRDQCVRRVRGGLAAGFRRRRHRRSSVPQRGRLGRPRLPWQALPIPGRAGRCRRRSTCRGISTPTRPTIRCFRVRLRCLDYAHPQACRFLAGGSGQANSRSPMSVPTCRRDMPAAPWTLSRWSPTAHRSRPTPSALAATPDGALKIARIDHKAQEDTIAATWKGPGSLAITGAPVGRHVAPDQRRHEPYASICGSAACPVAPVQLVMGCGAACQGTVDVTQALRAVSGKSWTSLAVTAQLLQGPRRRAA